MEFFGEAWDAPVCEADDVAQIPVPVGQDCLGCGEPIEEGDRGFAMPYVTMEGAETCYFHLECQVRSVVGGMAHLEQRCTCFGGTEHDGFSRAEARQVMAWVHERGRIAF